MKLQMLFAGAMKIYKLFPKKIGLLFFMIGLTASSMATPTDSLELKNDSIHIGLLTCSPGEESYELFGHTAIRVQYPAHNIDVVFNYGMFSFNTPHFLYRFTKGETDYMLGICDFQSFAVEYALRNSSVTEQLLNITQEEAHKLYNALLMNAQPQNRVYRYNFLYDNCSTRAKDIIFNNINEKVELADQQINTTFRKMINDCTSPDHWLTFGINLALGEPLDHPITYKESLFLPENMMQAFEKAHIDRLDKTMPLVKETVVLVEKESNAGVVKKENPLLSPLAIGFYLLILMVLITLYEYFHLKILRWIDTIIFTVYGLTGCVLFFLMFVSEHPATYPNYSGFWAHPFHLFVAIAIWLKSMKKAVYYYHFINFVLLMILLLCWVWLPQELSVAFLPFVMLLVVRSLSYLVVNYHFGNKK